MLRSVVLNEGLEELGDFQDGDGGKIFDGTQIERVTLPSTLRVLGNKIF